MIQQIERLGGEVSDLSNYDPSCTHLLCAKPARNEKSLSCMAAGKWVLHTSYLKKSLEAGQFVDVSKNINVELSTSSTRCQM